MFLVFWSVLDIYFLLGENDFNKTDLDGGTAEKCPFDLNHPNIMRVIKKMYVVKTPMQCALLGQGRCSSREMTAGIRLLFVVAGLLGLSQSAHHGMGLGSAQPGTYRVTHQVDFWLL